MEELEVACTSQQHLLCHASCDTCIHGTAGQGTAGPGRPAILNLPPGRRWLPALINPTCKGALPLNPNLRQGADPEEALIEANAAIICQKPFSLAVTRPEDPERLRLQLRWETIRAVRMDTTPQQHCAVLLPAHRLHRPEPQSLGRSRFEPCPSPAGPPRWACATRAFRRSASPPTWPRSLPREACASSWRLTASISGLPHFPRRLRRRQWRLPHPLARRYREMSCLSWHPPRLELPALLR